MPLEQDRKARGHTRHVLLKTARQLIIPVLCGDPGLGVAAYVSETIVFSRSHRDSLRIYAARLPEFTNPPPLKLSQFFYYC